MLYTYSVGSEDLAYTLQIPRKKKTTKVSNMLLNHNQTGVTARNFVFTHDLFTWSSKREIHAIRLAPIVNPPQRCLVHERRTVHVRGGGFECCKGDGCHQPQGERGDLHKHLHTNRLGVDTSVDVKETIGEIPVFATKTPLVGVVSTKHELIKRHMGNVGRCHPARAFVNIHCLKSCSGGSVVPHNQVLERVQETLYIVKTVGCQPHVAGTHNVEPLQEFPSISSFAFGNFNLPGEG